ncbi:guanylate kinase [Haloferula sargassicola]|uniref:Guanylate kinase n=1 Tax=Haloferula sargassicola TaxID=490096 RepID=A0ABP9UPJ6_9BACT
MRIGILYLVSGPSGSGKSTLCRRLATDGLASFSISCTTRPPRGSEQDGREYYFLDRDQFQAMAGKGEFLEHAEVYGNLYGTMRETVVSLLREGTDVVMDIDVQGAAQVRASKDPLIQGSLVDLFVMPPSEVELAARLKSRGTDTREVIELRLRNAIEEMSHWQEYRYRLLSSTREEDYARFKALLLAERMRVSRIV